MKTVLGYLSPYKNRIYLGLTVKSFATIIELFLPFLLAHVIDTIIPLGRIGLVVVFGLLMLITALGAYVGNILANRLAARVSTNAIKDLRDDSYIKILSFSNKTVDEFTIPSLISRMTSDTYHIYRMFNVIQRIGIRAPILLMGSLLMMLWIDTYLAMILIGLLPFISLAVYVVSKRGIPFYDSLQNALDIMVRVVRENIAGIRIIKSFAREDEEKIKYTDINQEVSHREKKAGLVVATLNPIMNLLLNLGLVVIIYVGAQRVLAGLSQTGSILAFLSYFTLILNSFLALNRIFLLMSRAGASANRISQILVKDDRIPILEVPKSDSEYHIEFENVSFSYNNTFYDIENIDFKIKHNTTFGIIGATGSGKSTIAQLLMRMYEVDKGRILINGEDIRSMDEKSLRKRFGVVFQNDALFSFSVKENIAFGRNLDYEAVVEAAEFAQARTFIEQLSHRYDEKVLRQGANFSGGQKQRMLIARALAQHPEIIILDDASSALDYQTDAQLRQAIKKSFHSTAIMITQRVSSVMHADQILMLDQGKMVGLGTHEQLAKTCVPYQELMALQLGGDDHEHATWTR